jgi:hypothetical protein
MKQQPFKLPNDSQRTIVIGKTGSGKTQAATWLLSQKRFDKRPFHILDFKRDKLINNIPGTQYHELGDKLPKKPGLYITQPIPGEEENVEKFLWDIWASEKRGLFLDETYMVDRNSKGLLALLTQGRSKQIPIIMCTQRPTGISRFCFSESEFVYLFYLNDERDKKTVREFVPFDISKPLPEYHGYWYDSPRNASFVMKPVPSEDEILDTFHEKLAYKRHVI